MKIEDAIKRYESWAEDDRIDVLIRKEHKQIADWLKELKIGRPRGEWIDDGLDAIGAMGVEYRWHKCSQCGFRISKSPSAYYPNFCEACGARMKGAEDE